MNFWVFILFLLVWRIYRRVDAHNKELNERVEDLELSNQLLKERIYDYNYWKK